jgi:diguanylate cyclase (GGDEF)-like protein
MSLRADRSRFRILVVIAAGLLGAAVLAIGLTVWWLRVDAISDATSDTGNLATVLAEQTNLAVQSIDLVLNEVQERLENLGARTQDNFGHLQQDKDTYHALTDSLSRLSQAALIALIDKNGRVVTTTQKWPTPTIDLTNRDYFQHFKDNDDKGIYVGKPVADHTTGLETIFFGKRINDSNNAFLGMIIVGVRVTYFQRIYNSIKSLNDQVFAILRKDGTLLVRYEDHKLVAGEKMPAGSPWYRLVSQGGGVFRSPGYFDGTPRLLTIRPLSDYPLVINVGVSETAALAGWRNHARTIGIGTLLVIICSVFLLRALTNHIKRLVSSEAALADEQAKVDAALNNMSQGLGMLDATARLVVCNQRYLEMYGLSPEIIKPGCSLREIIEHRAATGSFCADDIEQYLADTLAAVAQRAVFNKMTRLHDGRIIRIVNHPVEGGGWVSTHEDVTEEKRAEERIAYEAYVDDLTGLPNRKVFCEQLEQELKRVQRGERLALLYLDLDYLKQVNDTLGHAAGDKLLKGVADRLRGCVRDLDVVARLGGDEFAIIQKLLDQPSDAAALAMRVRDAIREPFDLDGHQVTVDISVGISIAPNDATELDELMKTADMALYEAKNAGRGTYCFYEPEMNARIQTRSKLEQDLQSALANGEFELFYQPIVSFDDDKITSFEALLRWNHPERGLVSPAEFVPIAEDMGLIIPLGEWVLRTACAEAATWPDNIQVAVNISPVQLNNKNLVNVVVGAIASAGIEPNRLELEITESVLIENTFANLATLKSLHDLGVLFAMDDFGTGYSSLSYLLSFPFHKIKIDRCFVAALSDNHESHAIVRAITDLARSLKLQVTAEGVETDQQLQQVRLLGCTGMQGYLLSPPRPAAEILQFFTPRTEYADNLIAVNASADRKNGKMCGIRPELVCNHLLTGRECDVLMGIMAGDTSKESARHLNISPRTIELHRARIKKKFDVKNSADLVRMMLTTSCPPSRPKAAFLYAQSAEITVPVTPPGGTVEEPESDPGAHRRVRAVK